MYNCKTSTMPFWSSTTLSESGNPRDCPFSWFRRSTLPLLRCCRARRSSRSGPGLPCLGCKTKDWVLNSEVVKSVSANTCSRSVRLCFCWAWIFPPRRQCKFRWSSSGLCRIADQSGAIDWLCSLCRWRCSSGRRAALPKCYHRSISRWGISRVSPVRGSWKFLQLSRFQVWESVDCAKLWIVGSVEIRRNFWRLEGVSGLI